MNSPSEPGPHPLDAYVSHTPPGSDFTTSVDVFCVRFDCTGGVAGRGVCDQWVFRSIHLVLKGGEVIEPNDDT